MTTTRALTCRAVAEHSPEPPHDRPALPGTAPTQIPRWTQDCRPDRAQIEVAVPEDLRAAVRSLAGQAGRRAPFHGMCLSSV